MPIYLRCKRDQCIGVCVGHESGARLGSHQVIALPVKLGEGGVLAHARIATMHASKMGKTKHLALILSPTKNDMMKNFAGWTSRPLFKQYLKRAPKTPSSFPGKKSLMGLGILPLKFKTLLGSKPLESRILVRRMAVGKTSHAELARSGDRNPSPPA